MLGNYSRLLFPSLRFVSDKQIVAHSSSKPKKVSLFRLDWTGFDSIISRRITQKTEQALPNKYEQYIQSRLFALTENHLRKICHYSNLAVAEFASERQTNAGFDADVWEICLNVSTALAATSFKLLCDCLFDEQTGYYARDPMSHIAFNIFALRFWTEQSADKIAWKGAELHLMEANPRASEEKSVKVIKDFLLEIKQVKRWANITRRD